LGLGWHDRQDADYGDQKMNDDFHSKHQLLCSPSGIRQIRRNILAWIRRQFSIIPRLTIMPLISFDSSPYYGKSTGP
jgi:hypothetical protein